MSPLLSLLLSRYTRRLAGCKPRRTDRPRAGGPPKHRRQTLSMEVLEDRTVPTAVGVPSGLATGPLLPSYGQLPLRFEANQGQTDAQVSFLARGSGYSLFLTPDQAVLRLQKLSADPRAGAGLPAGPGEVLRMQLVGANPAPQVAGLYELAAKSHPDGRGGQRWGMPGWIDRRYLSSAEKPC